MTSCHKHFVVLTRHQQTRRSPPAVSQLATVRRHRVNALISQPYPHRMRGMRLLCELRHASCHNTDILSRYTFAAATEKGHNDKLNKVDERISKNNSICFTRIMMQADMSFFRCCCAMRCISAAGVRPYRPQQDVIGHSKKTISATRKINIGHNHIGQNHIGHKIYGEFIWRHRVDTSLFRV